MPAPMSMSFVASGNIYPARFVKLNTSAMGQVTQSGAGEKCFGISQEGSYNVPYLALDDGYAAIANIPLEVFVAGAVCLLTLGGTVTRGDRLKSDASGQGVTTTSTGDEIGAEALASGTSGQMIPVRVLGSMQY